MAYSRYADIPEKKDANNRRVRVSTIYPPIPKHPDDTYVLTTVGDTLYALANQYYNSVNYYWVIAEANEGMNKATLNLAPGIQLRIPSQLNQIISDFRDLNNM